MPSQSRPLTPAERMTKARAVFAEACAKNPELRSRPLPAAEQRVKLLRGTRAIGAVIGVEPRVAWHLLHTGQLPGRKIGGVWCSTEEALLTYVTPPLDESAEMSVGGTAAQTAPARAKRWNKRRLAQPDAGTQPAATEGA